MSCVLCCLLLAWWTDPAGRLGGPSVIHRTAPREDDAAQSCVMIGYLKTLPMIRFQFRTPSTLFNLKQETPPGIYTTIFWYFQLQTGSAARYQPTRIQHDDKAAMGRRGVWTGICGSLGSTWYRSIYGGWTAAGLVVAVHSCCLSTTSCWKLRQQPNIKCNKTMAIRRP